MKIKISGELALVFICKPLKPFSNIYVHNNKNGCFFEHRSYVKTDKYIILRSIPKRFQAKELMISFAIVENQHLCALFTSEETYFFFNSGK